MTCVRVTDLTAMSKPPRVSVEKPHFRAANPAARANHLLPGSAALCVSTAGKRSRTAAHEAQEPVGARFSAPLYEDNPRALRLGRDAEPLRRRKFGPILVPRQDDGTGDCVEFRCDHRAHDD